jgi:hypothetical protein
MVAFATTGTPADEPARPAGPGDFDFLEGRWAIVYNHAQPGIPPNVPGTWTASWQADGRVLYDEFRLLGADKQTVILGATFRVFDHVRQRWDLRYVALVVTGPDGVVRRPAQWAEAVAWREGDRMRVDQRSDQRSLRITYYDIAKDHFKWKADVSTDGGQTWRTDQIRIEATRVRGER